MFHIRQTIFVHRDLESFKFLVGLHPPYQIRDRSLAHARQNRLDDAQDIEDPILASVLGQEKKDDRFDDAVFQTDQIGDEGIEVNPQVERENPHVLFRQPNFEQDGSLVCREYSWICGFVRLLPVIRKRPDNRAFRRPFRPVVMNLEIRRFHVPEPLHEPPMLLSAVRVSKLFFDLVGVDPEGQTSVFPDSGLFGPEFRQQNDPTVFPCQDRAGEFDPPPFRRP